MIVNIGESDDAMQFNYIFFLNPGYANDESISIPC